MRIVVNGQEKQIDAGLTVRKLLEQSNLPADKVAVELNRRLLKTERYDTALSENDEIEIVTFVGGG